MCLAKRIQPCKYCCDKLEIEEQLEKAEIFMEIGVINEGRYLEVMDRCKICFESCEHFHKQEGCKDLLVDNEVDGEEEVADTIAVEEFYWNEVLYYRAVDGHLFSSNTEEPPEVVGNVENGIVTIY